MHINGREIKPGTMPYIVCEVGAAHNGSLDRAYSIIKAAKACGADAVKFQCFTPDSITLNCRSQAFVVESGPWAESNLYDLYTEAHTPRGWFPTLFNMAAEQGIAAFASVFSPEDVDFLDQFDCPAYKISSFEITDWPLIKYAAARNKPMLISSGMAASYEVADAKVFSPEAGMLELHCVSSYPASAADSRLRFMRASMGLSDHTIGISVPVAATVIGTPLIEKHMTMCRADGGLDDGFASEPHEFAAMVTAVRDIYLSLNDAGIHRPDFKHKSLRRSLYVTATVKSGETFTPHNVRSIRPSGGLHPGALTRVLGKLATRDIELGEPLTWDMVRR